METLRVNITKADTGKSTSARVHIKDKKGKSYYPNKCIRYEKDRHFTVDGKFELQVPPGRINILVEKGKEYRSVSGTLEIEKGEDHNVDCELYPWIDMTERGWYSGDLHVHRPLENIPHLMLVEDLNFAPVITVWNDRNDWGSREIPEEKFVKVDENHIYGILTQEDERGGGAIMIINPDEPINFGETSRWFPANYAYCQEAKKRSYIVDQEKTFWWEAPVNIALGGVDTVEIVNNHMQREEMMDDEAWGRPRDIQRYPGQMGFVENVLNQYYHYLNLGIKLPISAGSASGVLKNPLGYNRLYVHLGRRFNHNLWLRGMKVGRAFATNGPMLFFSINHSELGKTIEVPAGEKFHGEVSVNAISQNILDKVQIIHNAEIIKEFNGGGNSEINQGFDIVIEDSGWLTARVFEKNSETVRFAHTNPVYIEIGSPMKPRKESAKYYLDWCKELLFASLADKNRYASSKEREEVENFYRRSTTFYRDLLLKS
ncbi:hypothetical protein GF312_16295 [Candidatus Poribacteria bacterium]|nr:hypothetical protein [Candidatus Poribacteria bacterium]